MFVKSKFLTGDVVITEVLVEEDTLKVIGSIKGMYPIEVVLNSKDMVDIVKASLAPETIVQALSLTASGLLSRR